MRRARFFPIFILLIVTFGLMVGSASAGQHKGGSGPWSQDELRIDASKAGNAPCVMVRPPLPLHSAEDPRAVATVLLLITHVFRSAMHAPLLPVGAEIPRPPSLTGRIVIRV